jgi:hypothetical protein
VGIYGRAAAADTVRLYPGRPVKATVGRRFAIACGTRSSSPSSTSQCVDTSTHYERSPDPCPRTERYSYPSPSADRLGPDRYHEKNRTHGHRRCRNLRPVNTLFFDPPQRLVITAMGEPDPKTGERRPV